MVKYKGAFNYSKLNNYAAKYSSGNVFLLLNNDVEFITSNWGYELASNALRPNIGFVGAKLLYDDNTIQHSGVILGIGGVAGHHHRGDLLVAQPTHHFSGDAPDVIRLTVAVGNPGCVTEVDAGHRSMAFEHPAQDRQAAQAAVEEPQKLQRHRTSCFR